MWRQHIKTNPFLLFTRSINWIINNRQVFWLILFRLPSHFTFCVTVAGGAGTIIGFTAAGTAPGFLQPFGLQVTGFPIHSGRSGSGLSTWNRQANIYILLLQHEFCANADSIYYQSQIRTWKSVWHAQAEIMSRIIKMYQSFNICVNFL